MLDTVFNPLKYEEVAPDIYQVDFLNEQFCEFIIASCNQVNTWAPNKHDKRYATHDIHLEKEVPDIYSIVQPYWDTSVSRLAEFIWQIDGFVLSDFFALKYSRETQTGLSLHHDDSYITGSVKLNNNYTGGDLYFPRQKFSSADVPVGSLLLFPGKITHPHKCNQLVGGHKYSLAMWTKESA